MTFKQVRAEKPRANTLTKEAILAFIQTATPNVGVREIARAFDVKGAQRIELKRILKDLAGDGLIADTRRSIKRDELPQVAVVAIRDQDADGDLFATPLHWNEDQDGTPPRILVTATRDYVGPALGLGDHVLARIRPLKDGDVSGARYQASPIKRLPREKTRKLGLLHKAGHGFVIQSIDKKDMNGWRVSVASLNGAVDGDLVAIEIEGAGRTGVREARVVDRIGNPKAERAISMIAAHNHGLRDQFDDDVGAELQALPALDRTNREDLTRVPLVTIDPEDAKDHDDAVFAERDTDSANEGGFAVIVAIADVSFYVRPNSALDREARLRGNSVYFPDRVIPMLPEKLSNDLCSLKEGELRPCLAVRMVFDRDGKKIAHRFTRGLMRSAAKLSYQKAQAAIDGAPSKKTAALLEPVLKPLWQAYTLLAQARHKRGPLDLDLPERKIILDKRGQVSRIVVPQRLDAHRLIEEFMIQANVAAAETLEAKKSPLVYRVHDAPASEKLLALSEFLSTLGINVPKTGFNRPSQFNRLLEKAKGTEQEELLNEVVLRSQARAEYSGTNAGHFGLNLRRYAHFTSPIRRYADLIVHRALVSAAGLGPGGLTDAGKAELNDIAEAISQAERKAMAAERETVDRLIAMHLSERTGEIFDARISGVTRFGLFVSLLETGADGFVPVATLGRDYYRHVETAHVLIGERSGESYRLGARVTVRLVDANPAAGALRFEMVSEGRVLPGLAKMAKKRRVRHLAGQRRKEDHRQSARKPGR